MNCLRQFRFLRKFRQGFLEPVVQGLEQWTRSGVSNVPAFIRGPATNLFLDRIERGDPFQRLLGNGRLVRFVKVIKLSSNVRPATCFNNRAAFIQPVESRECVGLQDAVKLQKVIGGMFGTATRRVCEPYSWRFSVTCRSIIANIGPESACLRFSIPRGQYCNRRVV